MLLIQEGVMELVCNTPSERARDLRHTVSEALAIMVIVIMNRASLSVQNWSLEFSFNSAQKGQKVNLEAGPSLDIII